MRCIFFRGNKYISDGNYFWSVSNNMFDIDTPTKFKINHMNINQIDVNAVNEKKPHPIEPEEPVIEENNKRAQLIDPEEITMQDTDGDRLFLWIAIPVCLVLWVLIVKFGLV